MEPQKRPQEFGSNSARENHLYLTHQNIMEALKDLGLTSRPKR